VIPRPDSTRPDPDSTRPDAARGLARPPTRGPARRTGLLLLAALGLAACDAADRAHPHPDATQGTAEGVAPAADASAAGTAPGAGDHVPGLHTLMMELQHRHATLWFAGDAENWPLADYFMHELEELLEDIGTLHPTYDGVPVAELLTGMSLPAVHRLEAAVDAADRAGFRVAYDELTMACNACHIASDRGAIVMQRPTSPPLTNLRYIPGSGSASAALDPTRSP